MLKRKITFILLSFLLLLPFINNKVYASTLEINDKYIDCEYTKQIILRVDSSKSAINVYLGNGLAVKFVRDYEGTITRLTACDSYSGYYYLTNSNDKVAVFSFSASFNYTGTSVTFSSSSASCSPLKDDWSISYSRSHDNSQIVLSTASCVFTLYYKGTYNNSNTVTILCTKSGVTSVVSN